MTPAKAGPAPASARYPFVESLVKRDEIVAARHRRGLFLSGSAVLLAAAGVIVALIAGIPQLFWLIAVALAVTIGSLVHAQGFSEQDYYAIPRSRDENGQHHCIYCGNRGIYRKGEYRTDNSHSSCSQCQKHLYSN